MVNSKTPSEDNKHNNKPVMDRLLVVALNVFVVVIQEFFYKIVLCEYINPNKIKCFLQKTNFHFAT